MDTSVNRNYLNILSSNTISPHNEGRERAGREDNDNVLHELNPGLSSLMEGYSRSHSHSHSHSHSQSQSRSHSRSNGITSNTGMKNNGEHGEHGEGNENIAIELFFNAINTIHNFGKMGGSPIVSLVQPVIVNTITAPNPDYSNITKNKIFKHIFNKNKNFPIKINKSLFYNIKALPFYNIHIDYTQFSPKKANSNFSLLL